MTKGLSREEYKRSLAYIRQREQPESAAAHEINGDTVAEHEWETEELKAMKRVKSRTEILLEKKRQIQEELDAELAQEEIEAERAEREARAHAAANAAADAAYQREMQRGPRQPPPVSKAAFPPPRKIFQVGTNQDREPVALKPNPAPRVTVVLKGREGHASDTVMMDEHEARAYAQSERSSMLEQRGRPRDLRTIERENRRNSRSRSRERSRSRTLERPGKR